MKKKLRVGFDLDGVLLYNPARIVRRPVVLFKHLFFPKREKKFLIPKSASAKLLWRLFHLSSIFPGFGFKEVVSVIKKYEIETFVITARYDFLEKDTMKWFEYLNKKNIFKNIYMNKDNMQPHLFKEKMVQKLKLDIFVEDNIDIVNYLNMKTEKQIYWVYNIFDVLVDYPNKHKSLKSVATQIKKVATTK